MRSWTRPLQTWTKCASGTKGRRNETLWMRETPRSRWSIEVTRYWGSLVIQNMNANSTSVHSRTYPAGSAPVADRMSSRMGGVPSILQKVSHFRQLQRSCFLVVLGTLRSVAALDAVSSPRTRDQSCGRRARRDSSACIAATSLSTRAAT